MCDPILVTLLKMQPHYSQSSRENATRSSGTSPLASYTEVSVPPPPHPRAVTYINFKVHCHTKSMVHIIIDQQIAYGCETDQMAEFHFVLTLV